MNLQLEGGGKTQRVSVKLSAGKKGVGLVAERNLWRWSPRDLMFIETDLAKYPAPEERNVRRIALLRSAESTGNQTIKIWPRCGQELSIVPAFTRHLCRSLKL
jgi:hypothetical protein